MPPEFILVSVTIAGYFDIRWRRVPNWLVALTIVLSWLWHGVVNGLPGLASSVAGLLGGIAVLFPFFLLRGMGAGDVKYFGALGAAVTHRHIFTVLLISLAIACLMAVYRVCNGRAVRATLSNIADVLSRLLHGRLDPHPVVDIDNKSALLIPFTFSVTLATWLFVFLRQQ